ncbi:MAG TPA: type II TA system antitoxin MqsA family protein [Stellaceae bacterium]|jgi:putative zinc finger/helix-turn-helix YgiT family protein
MAIETLSCSECGGPVMERTTRVVHHIGRREIAVEDDRHLYCAACDSVSYRGAMLDESQRKIASALRKEDGLLTPDELRAVRLKYGLTQAEMEKILTIGPKTWVRWERGKVVQGRAADQIIRLIASNPDVLRQLMNSSDIKNEKALATLDQLDWQLRHRIVEKVKAEISSNISQKILEDVVSLATREIRQIQREHEPSERQKILA